MMSSLYRSGAAMARPCTEQEQIVQSIRMVMSRILFLHLAEAQAIREADLDEMERIDGMLEKEWGRQASLLEKLQAHLHSHGCQPVKALR